MKPDFDHLGWYSRVFPIMKEEDESFFDVEIDDVVVFDCRALPVSFIEDTGLAVWDEYKEREEVPITPYADCFFEFGDQTGVYAGGCDVGRGPVELPETETTEELRDRLMGHDFESYTRTEYFPCWSGLSLNQYKWNIVDYKPDTLGTPDDDFGDPDDEEDRVWSSLGGSAEFHTRKSFSRYYDTEYQYEWNFCTGSPQWEDLGKRGQIMLLGVLTLMREKLVLERTDPDPAPRLTVARTKRGKYPVSGETRVLTVNVPMVRSIARKTPLMAHESPMLHWRRGHHRVIHRFSEFERSVWVKRCLVGDPDKGFVRKQYRLVHELPMLAGGKQ